MDGVDSSYSNTKYTFNEPILKVSISLWALFHFNMRRCVFLRHRFFSLLLLSLSLPNTHTIFVNFSAIKLVNKSQTNFEYNREVISIGHLVLKNGWHLIFQQPHA